MSSPLARADALEAFAQLAEQSPDAAERWCLALKEAISSLATMPKRHPVAEEESELLGLTLREMLLGKRRGVYRLLFSIQEDIVTIHYIRHASRGPLSCDGRRLWLANLWARFPTPSLGPTGGQAMRAYAVLYERGERNWSAYVPDLPGCVATGKTREETERRIREAIEFHIEGLRMDGDPVPEPTVEAGTISVSA